MVQRSDLQRTLYLGQQAGDETSESFFYACALDVSQHFVQSSIFSNLKQQISGKKTFFLSFIASFASCVVHRPSRTGEIEF